MPSVACRGTAAETSRANTARCIPRHGRSKASTQLRRNAIRARMMHTQGGYFQRGRDATHAYLHGHKHRHRQ
eukprot:2856749-Alexandrium_andersonii.AAC.1